MTDSRRLAVLIDADNVSSKVSTDLFAELAGYGTLTVKRAYGDWTTDQLNGWKKRLHEHAISPMQQFAYTTGKNSSDSALIIDAMDLLYAGHLDGFVIVSSDSDFTRLATRLRESAMTVYGVGASKTPRAFRDACDKFTFLEVLGAASTEEDEDDAPAPRHRRDRPSGSGSSRSGSEGEGRDAGEAGSREQSGALQSLLTRSLNKADSDDEDWTTLGALGTLLIRTDPSFDARTHGFGKLSDLIREQPFLETRTVTTSSGQEQLLVRLKGRRRAKGSAGRRGRGEGVSDVASAVDGVDGADGSAESPSDSFVPAAAPQDDAQADAGADAGAGAEPAVAPGVVDVPDVPSQPAVEAPAVPTDVLTETPAADPGSEPDDGPDAGSDPADAPAPATKPARKAATKKAAAKKTAAKKTTTKKAVAKKSAATTSDAEGGPAPAEKAVAKRSTRKAASKKAAAPEPTGGAGAAEAAGAAGSEAPAEPASSGPTVTVGRTARRGATRAAGPSRAAGEADDS